jgi:hypothetical protein
MRAAIELRVRDSGRRFRVIPVLLPGTKRAEWSSLPTFLAATTWVEFHNSLDDEEALHRLVSGIKGTPPGRWVPRSLPVGHAPEIAWRHGKTASPGYDAPILPAKARGIFISYAHADKETWLDRFVQFLQPLVRQEDFTLLVEMTEDEQNRVLLEVADQLAELLSENPR